MRKLVKTLLSLLLLAPAAALALGLGEIKLNSALNQRLDAEIELLSVDPGEVDDIKVSLASAESFSRIGLERPAVLMRVKFEVEQRANGDYVVKATTREVIREPFLDFLVEVNWPTGRVLREYTLLLDPPVSHTEQAPAITQAATAPSTQAAPSPAPAAAQEEGDVFVPPPSSIPVAPEAAAKQQQPQAAPQQPAAAAPAAPVGELVYGPVKANETLWNIALKMRPSKDISAQQMMMALLEANPYAFIDNNINRLKKGYVLRIDDPAILTAMSKAEAARQVAQQTRAWQEYRAAKAAKAQARQPVADTEAPAASASAPSSEPQLKLVAPEESAGEASGGAEDGAEMANASEELMLALESSAAQRKENEALQARVADLEAQLQDMQSLIELKDADLAALQQQLRQQGEAPAAATAAPEESPAQPAESAAKGEEATQPAAEEAAAATAQAPAEEKPAQQPAAPEAQKPEAKAETKPEPKPEPKPKKKPKPAPKPEPTFFESLMQDPLMLAAGGGTLVLVLVLVAVLVRRRRKGGFQESILSGGTSSMLTAKADDGSGETSFLSDLAISGMGGGAIAADEGEVDPITEADVFMAYGRNQQAEEVLKKALESNPERLEVIAKLLEVYHSSEEKEQFAELIEQSGEKLKDNEELWARVAPLGQQMMPEHALFAGVEAAPVEEKSAADEGKSEPMADDVLDIGLDLDELSAEMEGDAGDMSLDLGMDFDLDDEKKGSAEEKKSEEGDLSDMDFDLDFDSSTPEPTAEADEGGAAEDFDFELGTEGETEQAADDLDFDLGSLGEEGEAEATEEHADLDFDLGELGGETEQAPEAETSSSSDMDLGDLDFGDLEFGGADEEPQGESDQSGDFDLGELGGDEDFGDLDDLGDLEDDDSMLGEGDEISTKLDLAQAYIEMGDNEGARSMLEEVVEGGNDEQKQQAQALLDKI